jgi:hypothetical protein
VFHVLNMFRSYRPSVIIVSEVSFWRWSIGLKHVKDVKHETQKLYKLVTLDYTVLICQKIELWNDVACLGDAPKKN